MEQENLEEIRDNELVEATPIEIVEPSVEVRREVMNMAETMKMAEMLAKSTIIPITYQRRPENCFIALDMASRMGLSPIVVMQNLYVIQGRPSFSGSAIASMINASQKFEEVELIYVGEKNKDSWGAYVQAKNRRTGKILKGGTVTLEIAKKEGWYQKAGSKWQTMPEIMLAYRAYAWFGRVHAPEMMMGLQSSEEVYDVIQEQHVKKAVNPYEGDNT